MKRLKLFPKMFIYTFSILGVSILLVHLLVYLIFPSTYLNAKRKDMIFKADNISQTLYGKDREYIKQALLFFSKDGDIKAFIKDENEDDEENNETSPILEIGKDIEIDEDSDTNSVIIEEREVKLKNGTNITIEFLSTSNIQKNAKVLSLNLLPITISISFLFSVIIALIYAKFITNHINDIKRVTSKMMRLDRKAHLTVDSLDEAGELKRQINDLYRTLLHLMDDMEIKNKEILNLEKLKYELFRGASHELKTPLASLKIILENMSYNIGKYKDKDKYIKECIVMVDSLTEKVAQILTSTSFEYLKDDEELLIINDSLKEVIKNYTLLIKQKSITFNNDLKTEEIFIGKSALKIVLSNLLSNAVKYTDENGYIKTYVKDGFFVFENSTKNKDNLDLEKLNEIKFYSKKDNSNGLGLYIIKNILSNYKLLYRIEKTEIGLAFLIKLN